MLGGYPVWRVITVGSVPVCKYRTGFGSDIWNQVWIWNQSSGFSKNQNQDPSFFLISGTRSGIFEKRD
jgi:hypothetical protein